MHCLCRPCLYLSLYCYWQALEDALEQSLVITGITFTLLLLLPLPLPPLLPLLLLPSLLLPLTLTSLPLVPGSTTSATYTCTGRARIMA